VDEHDLLDLRLPEAFAEELYAILDSRRCLAWITLDDTVMFRMEGKPDRQAAARWCTCRSSPARRTWPPRIALIQGTETTAHVIEQLGKRWKERVRFVESFSSRRKSMLTLTAAGADKGAALSVACADMGLSTEEVVAFGDAEADIEMFASPAPPWRWGKRATTSNRWRPP
jgi:hydroxymethylpyrimidine pyrophosphatase-like HAD family hydrolase